MTVFAAYSTRRDLRTQSTLYLGVTEPAGAESRCPRCGGRITVGEPAIHVVVPDRWSGWLHEHCAGPVPVD